MCAFSASHKVFLRKISHKQYAGSVACQQLNEKFSQTKPHAKGAKNAKADLHLFGNTPDVFCRGLRNARVPLRPSRPLREALFAESRIELSAGTLYVPPDFMPNQKNTNEA